MRLLCIAALSLCLISLAASSALAHTRVVGQDPAEGASLRQAPERVVLELDGPVEAEFGPLEVYDERGERVDLDDARLESGGETLLVGLREGLGGGEYEVEYRYTGVDGHPIDGSYGFSVSGDYEPPPAGPAAETGESGGGARGSRTGGIPAAALYGALGVGALAAVGAVALRRR